MRDKPSVEPASGVEKRREKKEKKKKSQMLTWRKATERTKEWAKKRGKSTS